MKWSSKVAEVGGIGIYVHWTFLILLGWLVAEHILQGDSLAAGIKGIALVLAIFACIVLHELGHALMARRFGIRTSDITLLPIGGVARLERMPEDPTQELWVAMAGPAVNVVIAAILFAVIGVLIGLAAFTDWQLVGGNFLVSLMVLNLGLVVFNLLPAFPMDGGRVLRALLAKRLDYVQATQIAASVGQAAAIVFAVLGLFGSNWFLLFIALFVYLGAQQEAHVVQVRSLLRGVPVRAAMITRFQALSETDPLSMALDELLAGHQQDFPVLAQERIAGLLTRNDLMAAVAQGRQNAAVGEVMRRDCMMVDEGEMLEATFERMRAGQCSALPVLRAGRLVGMITLENVGEWLMIHSAFRHATPRGAVEDIYRHA
jgi:Zn-dependent protease/CBS domain-containing protein